MIQTNKQVLTTSNLDQFKIIQGNRPINKSHLKHLEISIQEKNLLEASPIIVNEKMEVIDGQHRLEVARKLELPIDYIVVEGLSLSDIQRLNSNNKNWGLQDYLEAYCLLGEPEYLRFKKFLKDRKINLNNGLLLAIGTGNGDSAHKNQLFREGGFKIKDMDALNHRADVLVSFQPFYRGYTRRSFLLAVLKMLSIDIYDHTRMLEKLRFQADKLTDCTTQESYLKILEKIYNYRSSGEDKVRFF